MKRTATALAIAILVLMAAPVAVMAAGAGGEHTAPGKPHINWTTGLFDLSHQSLDANGGELEAGEHPMNPPFVAVIINFAIFIGLLVWKAGPPISSYLKKRHDDVKGALEEAARMQKEAADTLADRKRKLSAVDAEVDELIDGMKKDAASEKKRMIADAETAAAALKRDADERIAATTTRARQAIEAEVIAAAVEAAEALIREHANDDDHNALVESFIDNLASGTFGGGGGGGGTGGGGGKPKPLDIPPPITAPPADTGDVDEGWS